MIEAVLPVVRAVLNQDQVAEPLSAKAPDFLVVDGSPVFGNAEIIKGSVGECQCGRVVFRILATLSLKYLVEISERLASQCLKVLRG